MRSSKPPVSLELVEPEPPKPTKRIGRPPRPKPGIAKLPDAPLDPEGYLTELQAAARGVEVTFEQKLKLGHIMVKWAAVKKGMPDDSEGSAWLEGTNGNG